MKAALGLTTSGSSLVARSWMALPRMHSEDKMKITPRMTQALQNETYFKFQGLFIIIIVINIINITTTMQCLVTHSHIHSLETIVFAALVSSKEVKNKTH